RGRDEKDDACGRPLRLRAKRPRACSGRGLLCACAQNERRLLRTPERAPELGWRAIRTQVGCESGHAPQKETPAPGGDRRSALCRGKAGAPVSAAELAASFARVWTSSGMSPASWRRACLSRASRRLERLLPVPRARKRSGEDLFAAVVQPARHEELHSRRLRRWW